MIQVINQVYEIDKKAKDNDISIIRRNIDRLYVEFENLGYKLVDPIGRLYDDRDASIEANVIENKNDKLYITKVLKPCIYHESNDQLLLIQKAIVIVE